MTGSDTLTRTVSTDPTDLALRWWRLPWVLVVGVAVCPLGRPARDATP
jgi:hypothetical protein